MATRVLYMEERRGQEPDPCYAREFDARILERGPDFVVLDQTLFYAEGGGQPDDTGTLRWKDGEARVLRVTKEKGVVKHHVDRMPSADGVHGAVEWDQRYKHMRMHTSQHLMSGLVFRTYGARTVGNQIHMDYSRVDFQPANFTPEDLKRIEDDSTESSLHRRTSESSRRTAWSSRIRSKIAPSWISSHNPCAACGSSKSGVRTTAPAPARI